VHLTTLAHPLRGVGWAEMLFIVGSETKDHRNLERLRGVWAPTLTGMTGPDHSDLIDGIFVGLFLLVTFLASRS
jgi:hypothetical protein